MSDEPRRPRQSGMEHEQELVVRDLLNFLHGIDIPFFKDPRVGVKSGHLSTRERLELVARRLHNLARDLSNAMGDLQSERSESRRLSGELSKVYEILLGLRLMATGETSVEKIREKLETCLVELKLIEKPIERSEP